MRCWHAGAASGNVGRARSAAKISKPGAGPYSSLSGGNTGRSIGGERGIRTLEGLLTLTPLAGVRLRPLGHLSANAKPARRFAAQSYSRGAQRAKRDEFWVPVAALTAERATLATIDRSGEGKNRPLTCASADIGLRNYCPNLRACTDLAAHMQSAGRCRL